MTIDDWRVLIVEVQGRAKFPRRKSTIINRQSSIGFLSATLALLILFTDVPAHAQEPIFTLRGHERWVLSIAISPDGRFLVSGSKEVIRVWKLT